MNTLNGKSYDELCEQARLMSLQSGGYAAVVEQGLYMGNVPFITIRSSPHKIQDQATRTGWCAVVAQYRAGRPAYRPAPAPAPAPELAEGELPF